MEPVQGGKPNHDSINNYPIIPKKKEKANYVSLWSFMKMQKNTHSLWGSSNTTQRPYPLYFVIRL